MALTEHRVIDQITVSENGSVHVRETVRIIKDEIQIAQNYHRITYSPGQDLTGVPPNVAAICNVAWTPEVIAAFQASLPQPNTEAGSVV